MKKLNFAASVLVFIGAMNWGLIGLFNLNLIDFFLENEFADRFIYSIVGIAAIYKAVYWRAMRTLWKED
ncbi:MAG TPA: DUF378 domain-containing protein [Chlamydiales bacterium]|nr:DUF378 domain-containing protein [Chlamydiales bacterium]